MATTSEEHDSIRDIEDDETLSALQVYLEKAGVSGIASIGPIDAEGSSCRVVFEKSARPQLPERFEVTLSNKRTVVLQLVPSVEDAPVQLLSGPIPPPWQYSGPLMGGDPIWNNAASMWGTVTFSVAAGSSMKMEGHACANHAMTCHHVLKSGSSVDVSTTRYANALKLQWLTNPPNGVKWVDMAGAEMRAGTPHTPLKVRGLGLIKGLRLASRGMRVSKYGTTTGLTSGRDLGTVSVKLVSNPPQFFKLRQVSGYFSAKGDSGAPVMTASRHLVGAIVAGRPGVINENYYMQAIPKGAAPPGSTLSSFEIDGL